MMSRSTKAPTSQPRRVEGIVFPPDGAKAEAVPRGCVGQPDELASQVVAEGGIGEPRQQLEVLREELLDGGVALDQARSVEPAL
jgi:hypothetical protein